METMEIVKEKEMLVPKLRFREFKNEWLLNKIGEICKITSGGTPNRNNASYWNGNIPWISTSLIDFNFIEKSEEYITQDGVNNSSAKLFPEGTILMAMYGQGKTRGKVAILGIPATTNQACAAILVGSKVNNIFLFQNLAGRYEEVRGLSNDGGQQNLSAGIIKEIKVAVPSLSEQHKIASFLSAVDEKIKKLTRKKELLEQYKKAVMQQIFSRKLRFKNENGKDFPEWEEKRLGDVSESIKSGKSKSSEIGKYSLYGSTGIIGKCEKFSHDGLFILVARVGANAGTINIIEGKFGVSDNTLVISSSPHMSIWFLYFFLSSFSLNKLIFGSGQPLITGGLLKELLVKVPNLGEQDLIAEFLFNIDKKLEKINNQITQTQTFKKGLLQQMFC